MRRIQRDIRTIKYKLIEVPESPKYIKVQLPTHTIYGSLIATITFNEYPFGAPTVNLSKVIYHPNVADTGSVCMSILTTWSPVTNIQNILDHLMVLLDNPDLSNPINAAAASTFINDISSYNKINMSL